MGGRYRAYVELDDVPVWVVIAAPEFDIEPIPRCYPLIGCAIYRGYFSRRLAQQEAARLAVDHDVHLSGSAAYSTLGWFDDPLLSSFIHYDEPDLADLIFHELAHSVVYVGGDSAFNESFAGFVGNAGALLWLARRGGDWRAYQSELARDAAFARFLDGWRRRLADLYEQPIGDDAMRQLKDELFAAMRADYRRDRQRLGGGRRDVYMDKPFDNARLAGLSAYETFKPAFARLFHLSGEDWAAFFEAVRELGALPAPQRLEQLRRLAAETAESS